MLQNNCLQIPTQKAEIIENCIALVLQWHFDSVKHQTYDTVNIHITYVCVCVCVYVRAPMHTFKCTEFIYKLSTLGALHTDCCMYISLCHRHHDCSMHIRGGLEQL